MDPTEWRWKQERDELIPIMKDKNAAPNEFLKIIYGICSRECKSARRSCRRYGLLCTAAWKLTIQTTPKMLIQKKVEEKDT
jgi:hypothetical protein